MDEPMDEDALMVFLQQMLANKAAGPSEMRARVAAEVDVAMDNGVTINPLLARMYGGSSNAVVSGSSPGEDMDRGEESESESESESEIDSNLGSDVDGSGRRRKMLRTRLMTDSSTVMYIDQVTVRAQVCAINNAGSHVRGPLSALASRRSPQARCPQIPRVCACGETREEGNRLLRAGFCARAAHHYTLDTKSAIRLNEIARVCCVCVVCACVWGGGSGQRPPAGALLCCCARCSARALARSRTPPRRA